jgi:DNA-binding HxlR family transcriptional regulator
MQHKSFAEMACPVAQCLDVVGQWWTLLIVRDAFLGVTRFDDFQQRLDISRGVLNQRLASLVDAGILRRRQYSQRPPRSEYLLTDKGRDLWPVLNAMREWGQVHTDAPPLEIIHHDHACATRVTCEQCGEEVRAEQVTIGR